MLALVRGSILLFSWSSAGSVLRVFVLGGFRRTRSTLHLAGRYPAVDIFCVTVSVFFLSLGILFCCSKDGASRCISQFDFERIHTTIFIVLFCFLGICSRLNWISNFELGLGRLENVIGLFVLDTLE